ncbi:MAG: S-layer homology domain-containing protein, partial [Oscillospiraceae bacterium]|nr:S-layer homology domain-containing protein [Oscillospiraceae bacterium]
MRKTGMRLLAVLLAVVMVLPSVLIPGMAAEATGFTDVPEGSWYEDAVNYVSEKGYMTGVGDNRFAPNDEVTRAMFVTILARITMAETDGTVSAFTDVPVNKWYTGAVSWAAENGIVNGVGDGMFAPGKSITRQDLCTILYRFVNAMDYELTVGEEKTFTDSASVSSYAAEAVRYASSVGLIAGYDDGTFRPKATATRAQMAVIIMRLARLLDGQIVKPEPMPAQSFNGAAGDDMTVSVNAPKGALPENTNMTVSRVTDEAALAAIAEKADLEIVAAADITFKKDGAKLEPEKAVEVQISLDGMENLQNPYVIHVRDDGGIEYMSVEVVSISRDGSGKALRFYAKDFSVYAVGDGGTNPIQLLTVEFYAKNSTGNWEKINAQGIRMDQISKLDTPCYDPGVPTLTATQSFEGWFLDNTEPYGDFTEEDAGLSVADINTYIKTNYNASS